jgi:transcription antitermination factor NusG
MELAWYAVYTKPRAEAKVADRLLEKGLEVYYPTVHELRQWSDRKKMVERPLFSSYVFVKADLTNYQKVRQVYGVVNFVYHLGKPAKIREQEIEAIKSFLNIAIPETISFEPYQEVLIIEGPLAGKKGTIESVGKNTLRLSISELKLSLKAEISHSKVEKV